MGGSLWVKTTGHVAIMQLFKLANYQLNQTWLTYTGFNTVNIREIMFKYKTANSSAQEAHPIFTTIFKLVSVTSSICVYPFSLFSQIFLYTETNTISMTYHEEFLLNESTQVTLPAPSLACILFLWE
jgi:hypothetical protein